MRPVRLRTRRLSSMIVRTPLRYVLACISTVFYADLGEKPVQYREVQGYESPKFLSYFSRFLCLNGGVSTGFHHVSAPPPDNTKRLYRVISTGTRLLVREVAPIGASLIPGDAYVLDMGSKVWQLNTKGSVGKERFKAAEFSHSLANDRTTTESCEVMVFGKRFPQYWSLFAPDLILCA